MCEHQNYMDWVRTSGEGVGLEVGRGRVENRQIGVGQAENGAG